MHSSAATAAHAGIFDHLSRIQHLDSNRLRRYLELLADDLTHDCKRARTGIGHRRGERNAPVISDLNESVGLATLRDPVGNGAASANIFGLGSVITGYLDGLDQGIARPHVRHHFTQWGLITVAHEVNPAILGWIDFQA